MRPRTPQYLGSVQAAGVSPEIHGGESGVPSGRRVISMKGLSIRLIDPAADERWDAFVARARCSSVFQHSLWKAVIERTFPAKPLYLAVEDDANAIRWGMPFFLKKSIITGNGLISLPFSDYSDILTDDKEEFRILWGSVTALAKQYDARYIEIRARSNPEVNLDRYSMNKKKTYLNHYLEVGDDLEFIEKKVIEKSYKYDIRQALRNGVTCEESTEISGMRQYYKLYLMTRKRHGLPPMPYVFFRNVWDILYPARMVHLFLAYWHERPIGGIIFLRHGECLYALSNSSDPHFLDKKPNHLLWWKGIELAVKLGLKGLDFGRTSVENEGLRFFKRRWGTEELEICHYRYDMGRTSKSNGSGTSTRLIRTLPSILRTLPPWTLRLMGDIAYRRLCLW